MRTEFASGIAEGDDGYTVGTAAANDAFETLDAEHVDFCQVFSSSRFAHAETISGIRSVIGDEAALIGCASTGEFSDTRNVETGVALGLVTSDTIAFHTGLGTGLTGSTQRALREARSGIPASHDSFPHRSALVLHDGFAGDGERLALQIRRKLGARVPFAGGAASDNYDFASTPVFCGDRVETDALALAVLDSENPAFVTDAHGHEPISEPLEVASADGVVIEELDGRPAFEVWREVVRPHAREMLDVDIDALEPTGPEMISLASIFELGIDQGDDYKIRYVSPEDPEAGTMGGFVEIPEGTRVHVMCGTVGSQIDSARQAARNAHQTADGEYAGAFVYDCACREIILGEAFETAVDAMADELDAPFAGFETYGEMSMTLGQTSGFHNSTTVISLLPK